VKIFDFLFNQPVDNIAAQAYSTIRLSTEWLSTMQPDKLSVTLSALADPTRRGILARLATGDATVKELAEPYDMSLAAVSKHLKVLEGAGLISRGKDAQYRPCRLEAGPLRDVDGWLESYRRFWEESLDQLEVYLAELQKGDPDGTPN
jgi:DNA-binding transcriptional ArsR family regulator